MPPGVDTGDMTDRELTTSVWDVDADDFPSTASIDERARFLLRYAVLAPSSHNAQPWRFDVDGDEVVVTAEESRWLAAADPDERELLLSVGCAVENLRVAAERFGFDPRVAYHDDRGTAGATVTLVPADEGEAAGRPTPLFDAITDRRTSHAPFDGRTLDATTLERLRAAVVGADVGLRLVDDPDRRRAVAELQAEADRLLMDDPDYRKELGRWIGRGTLGTSWLLARVGQAVVTHLDLGDREAAKNSALVESAPVVAVLTTDADEPQARIEAGRAFERVALRAAAEGVAVHPMSQTLERPALRERLAALLDCGTDRPQHLFRIGYADEPATHTPRWPLETFLVDDAADPR
jgi:nitroreductase